MQGQIVKKLKYYKLLDSNINMKKVFFKFSTALF